MSLTSTVRLYDLHPSLGDMRAEVMRGLSQPQKAISPKFLYDKTGAELFDAICTLEEYYLTRTEMAILQTYAAEMATLIGDGVLIEFGSGSCQKIRILLDALLHLSQLPTYVALDISKQHLLESCENLVAAYPTLEAIAICADYTQPVVLPQLLHQQHKIAFFPGSSIGNLEPPEVVHFLQNSAELVQPGGGLIIGVDLQKSAAILEPAYDDAQGISARFALNLLARLNRDLHATFNLEQFSYKALYNPAGCRSIGRIEMYIVSQCEQTVEVDGVPFFFDKGETILTEHSYKYSIPQFQTLAQEAGCHPECVWMDPQNLFSIHYLQCP